jgi:hypothetical protein
LAVIEINNDAVGNPPSGTKGGTNNGIPVLLMSVDDGLALSNLLATTSVTITADLGDDASLNLGQYEGGKGYSDQDFSVSVPQPGIYPIRIVYEQGGGGANMEFSQFLNGLGTGLGAIGGGSGTNSVVPLNQVLVNDVAHGGVATFAKLLPTATHLSTVTAPVFTSVTSTTTTLTLTWTPTSARLQQASSLATSGAAKWSNVTVTTAGTYTATFPASGGGSLFFRLINP